MGNLLEKSTSKYILNTKNYEYLESNLLEFSGLSKKEIRQKNVLVGTYHNEPIYTRTIIIGNTKFPKLVWIHGYAASGALFYKMMKALSEIFCIYFIDIVGMGGSSRPDNYLRFKFSP
jgi:cephalosporin-C deacetylase-like acetyl esterase